MNRVALGLKLLKRDALSGEMTLLVLALIIAVSSSTAISLFADRLHRTMSEQASEFLAADLVITGHDEIPSDWLNKAENMGLQQSKTAEFSSVLIENDQFLLAGVKSVSSTYPLKGELKTIQHDFTDETAHQRGPEQGQVWVGKRVLSALKLTLGDTLHVGEQALVISHIITYEPDKRGDFYSLSPRVMMHEADLEKAQILKPGSHAHRFFQFAGSSDLIRQFNQWVKPQLHPSQRLMDVQDDRPELGSALMRAERYLGLSSILVIVIAGVAIAMATRRYSERHFDQTAILRCLGCQQNDMVRIFLYQFLCIGVVACSIGLAIGWVTQQTLFELLRELLPAKVAQPSLYAVLIGFLTGFAILIGFALPPLLRLKNVSPLRVLRHDLIPVSKSASLMYGLAFILVSALIYSYTEDLKLMSNILGGGLAVVLVLGGFLWWLLKRLRSVEFKTSLALKMGLQGVLRSPVSSVFQILAFSITLLAMLLSFSVRNDLLQDWQKQLPENAPNHFAMNVLPDQLPTFQNKLKTEGVSLDTFYPIVRGRLVEINDIAVQQLVSKESQGERATHRDLSLTWLDALPEDNQTVEGHWDGLQKGSVSVESKLAKSLNVGIGDKLTFSIGFDQVSAKVTHIRKVEWDTMKPNFYMVLDQATLEAFPTSYITSFYLSDEKKQLLNVLGKDFANVTVLEVDAILKQFQLILKQLTSAINYVLVFALLAGVLVLLASVYSTLDARLKEGALMRVLGANKALLWRAFSVEFAVIGLIAGVMAVVMFHIIIYLLYTFVLHIDVHFSLIVMLGVPLLSGALVLLAGAFGVRDVVRKPPLPILRAS